MVLAPPGAIAIGDDAPFRVVSVLAGAALLDLIVLIPVATAFGVDRSLRTSARDQPDAMPE